MTPERELLTAHQFFQTGKLPEAEAACRGILEQHPRNAAVLHLLGLIRKDAGDPADGERLLRESIELEPGRAEFRTNLGNLMRRLGRLDEAETVYRKALTLDPDQHSARLGLARTLSDLGRHAEAEGEARVLIAARGGDPQSWSTLARTMRDQGHNEEAEQAFRQALALAPDDALIHHNLAMLLLAMNRGEDALETLNRAHELGMRGFSIASSYGRVLAHLHRYEEAEGAYSAAVEMEPTNSEAQLDLAKLRFMMGDSKFARSIATAVGRFREDTRLQLVLADILHRVGELQPAEALLRHMLTQEGAQPEVRALLALVFLESGRLQDAEIVALQATALHPKHPAVIESLVNVLLSLGRGEEALPFIRTERKRAPRDQRWIAYEATAARLTGDPLYGRLYDCNRLVKVYDFEPPRGWRSVDSFNRALIAAIAPHHRLVNASFEQSVRYGTRVEHDFATDPHPATRALMQALGVVIADYRTRLGEDEEHPTAAHNRGAVRPNGSWSVRLRSGGYDINHVHSEGWLSAVYFVSASREAEDANRRSGWLKLGEPRFTVPDARPERMIAPRPGRLVLFPSYMWQGTTPTRGEEPQFMIGLDIMPVD